MKTLAVYYSKTGNTKKAADAVINAVNCDIDEIIYDEASKTVKSDIDPSDYERVILLSPVWAFSLAEPMKLYLKEHKSAINNYSLIVTCSAVGLRGCVGNCKKVLGKPPVKAVKIKAKNINAGNFSVSAVL